MKSVTKNHLFDLNQISMIKVKTFHVMKSHLRDLPIANTSFIDCILIGLAPVSQAVGLPMPTGHMVLIQTGVFEILQACCFHIPLNVPFSLF